MIDSHINERNTHEHTQNTDTGAGEDRGEERESQQRERRDSSGWCRRE